MVNENIFSNVLLDWIKKDVTPEEKSVFIKEYLKKHNISERELGRRFNIPHSTVHDWVSMRQVNKARSNKEIDLGVHSGTITSLASRLLFLLSKAESINDRDRKLLNDLVCEIEKHNVLIWEGK